MESKVVAAMGRFGLGIFVGFVVTVVISLMYPGIGHIGGGLLGGFIAGLIVRGAFKGAFAGFVVGVLSAILLGLIALTGFAWAGGEGYGLLGVFLAGIVGTALSILVSIVATVASVIAGFFGGLISSH